LPHQCPEAPGYQPRGPRHRRLQHDLRGAPQEAGPHLDASRHQGLLPGPLHAKRLQEPGAAVEPRLLADRAASRYLAEPLLVLAVLLHPGDRSGRGPAPADRADLRVRASSGPVRGGSARRGVVRRRLRRGDLGPAAEHGGGRPLRAGLHPHLRRRDDPPSAELPVLRPVLPAAAAARLLPDAHHHSASVDDQVRRPVEEPHPYAGQDAVTTAQPASRPGSRASSTALSLKEEAENTGPVVRRPPGRCRRTTGSDHEVEAEVPKWRTSVFLSRSTVSWPTSLRRGCCCGRSWRCPPNTSSGRPPSSPWFPPPPAWSSGSVRRLR